MTTAKKAAAAAVRRFAVFARIAMKRQRGVVVGYVHFHFP
jgi:hypothetical protein